MKRILKIKLDLEKGVQFSEEKIFTQGDLNTHFLNIILPKDLDLTDKTMQINFIKSNKKIVFELINTLSQENEIKISNNVLDIPGKVLLEIILKKSDIEVLTINKLAYFIVTQTVSGTNIEIEPGTNTISLITEKLSQLSVALSKIETTKTEVNNATNKFKKLNNTATQIKDELLNKNTLALETTRNLNLLNTNALTTKENLNTLNIKAIQNKKDLENYIRTEKDKLKGEQGIQGPNGKNSEIVFNTKTGTILEGSKLAETLGIPYGGILNNSNSKVVGTAYYDTTTKKTYKCTSTTPLNYAESTKFEPISNNDLLLKFQNLKSFLIES